jgi:DNA-binding NarL/FixJ family response regulator
MASDNARTSGGRPPIWQARLEGEFKSVVEAGNILHVLTSAGGSVVRQATPENHQEDGPNGRTAIRITNREGAILCLIARGFTNEEIARDLCISSHTVAQHVAGMLRRWPARSRSELVARAYSVGILRIGTWPPPDPELIE